MLRRSFLAASAAVAGLPACGQTFPNLPEAVPTSGFDRGLLSQALDLARALPKLRALIVARDGAVAAEEVFAGPDLDTPVNVKSASKSILAALAGAAFGAGVLEGPEQPISAFLEDRFPRPGDPRLRAITVGHLLSMQAGLGSTSGPNYGPWVSSRDWVRYALSRPFESEPGGRMIYSTGTSHLLSAVLTQASGRSTLSLAREWLGGPLDIDIPTWPADPQGIYFGGNDMRLSPRALLRFGELYRDDGVRGGARVLPSGWVETSWNGRGTSRWSGNPYGYGWWIKRVGAHPVYFAWGYGGQMVFVVPSLNMTVVMTSDPTPVETRDGHVDRLHGILDAVLIPAAERGGT